MFLVAVLLSVLLATSANASEFCYNEVEAACSPKPGSTLTGQPNLINCNAKYGSIEKTLTDLQSYANGHIETSYEHLLMSTHFGNYESNREGFKKLYRKLSDLAWEKSIEIMKYIASRGGSMNFNQLPHFKKNAKESRVLELSELHSLAKALDTEKQLANEALRMHNSAMEHRDSAVAHFLEEEFMEKQTETVRNLAGHTSDLTKLLNRDAPLAVYLFDEYLQKVL